ncbi:alanine--glyoxylate aminotransferase family protein [Glaciecola sp. KUL10]|uniref:pyridoxal-phosphate-dependent aminotransferase family protein n=1 Tax=Glaciecola sp. (strain KUL10) TaxID=2161813 RepID=UPI000D8CDE17|nr:alanine--glyoxylate aminotransferase family protein [Glaciecola sp. KUL10]GBL04512.1 aminotransferase class V [Glaciecola sp. KUL10]
MSVTSIKSFKANPPTLMGPGPSDVDERVLRALAQPTLGHLDPNFIGLMDETKHLLQQIFKTKNEMTMPISAPGSAGMEACFVNLVEPGDKVIVCQNGVFGGRMYQNVVRSGGEAILVEDPWGEQTKPEKLMAALAANPDTKIVAFVHAETSTGVENDAKTLCAISKEYGCLTIVDTVTSLAGIPLYVDEWQIDATYSGTQKCLSCVPGLSPVSFSELALGKIKNRKSPVQSWFLDLNLILGYWGQGTARAYHHTAPVNSIYAFHESLVAVLQEGIEDSWKRHAQTHDYLREGLESLGLNFTVDEAYRLPQLNVVRIPEGIDDAITRRRLLNEFGLEIGAGLGEFAGRVWRIGLMGSSCSKTNVDKCISALREVLGK